jgi:GNAT superfamily N-acetyltransferase
MEIVEYQDIDPLEVLFLNQLAHDMALTPEKAAHIRQTEPRAFPCLAIYAIENKTVLEQVGIFRLPVVSSEGREDVGGLWSISTHPKHSNPEITSILIEEAHTRMREAGLRFSTLETDRSFAAYSLFCQLGYVETNVWATALAHWETAHQPTRILAQSPGPEGYEFVEQVFNDISSRYLGFSRRHSPFYPLRNINIEDILILWYYEQPVGYALIQPDRSIMQIHDLFLKNEIDAAEAVSAVSASFKSGYVQVTLSHPKAIHSLRKAGFLIAQPNRSAFMIKPLVSGLTLEDARHLFGVGTDQFLISRLDLP